MYIFNLYNRLCVLPAIFLNELVPTTIGKCPPPPLKGANFQGGRGRPPEGIIKFNIEDLQIISPGLQKIFAGQLTMYDF
jgi:hypothetical protein